jgi:serine/threonine protein kinase
MASAAPAIPPPRTDAAALPGGYRIHEYEIERQLGGGGFGITYLARDANLQLPVAIKEYFPSDLVTRGPAQEVLVRTGNEETQASYDWGLERFLDEARVLATFRHPNIVRVLRYFRQNGTAYIVMEYESGLALKRWVPQNAPLSQRSLLSIIYPLLDGLEAVHKTGFLHRDIKPDNIYVRADGTPVLLDFGAARRVSSNQDMTNIVSPGFAPFEQYHSHGNQGPWTDIYSLGAVMYWMTTGKKPVESAARVKSDSLLPATSVAESSVYGQALLQAVDWAMQPDEAKRPQTVSAFRAAIQGSEYADAERATVTARTGLPANPGVPSAGGPSNPGNSGAGTRRNLLCTIMFLDLVGYSVRSVDDQAAIKKLFNTLLSKALKGVAEESRIAIDTGDGAAICFMGDPEEALSSALLLRDLIGQRYGNNLTLRIGLHMGPVRVIADINERVNVIGDGINVAQRIMDFARGSQVLVSRAYYDVISRITDDTASMFRYLGPHEDKHGRVHEVYSVENTPPESTTRKEGPATGYTQTRPMRGMQALSPEGVAEIESELARNIGPLARVLVRKAQPLASSLQDLRDALAPSIQEPKARDIFIAGPAAGASQSSARSRSASVPSGSRPGGASRTVPGGHGSFEPASQSMPLGRSGPPSSASMPLGPSGRGPDSRPQLDVPAADLAVIEQALSKIIGPMARMLIRKELGRCATFREFIAAVGNTIDQPQQRKDFILALKRDLPPRQF